MPSLKDDEHTCGTCFWCNKEHCHLNPPTPVHTGYGLVDYFYPVVSQESMGCSKHSMRNQLGV